MVAKNQADVPKRAEDGEIEDDVQARHVAVNKEVKLALIAPGMYVPPAKRRLLEQQQQLLLLENGPEKETASSSLKSQKESWQTQKRVIHGTINRLNAGTIKPLIQELFEKVNLIQLRGVLCKNVLQATITSPKFAGVYAALISVINSKLPEVGELVVKRSILSFRRYYKRRERASCQAICIFLAHLFHQAVLHELILLQLLSVLLDGDPTDDSVEVAIQLLQVTGQALLDVSPAGVRACTERLRALLHEGKLNKRVEYKMERLLKMRKTGFRDFPPVVDGLDLVERDDQITHEISLDDDDIQKEDSLDVFSVDPNYEESTQEWNAIRAEILGEGGSSSDDDSDDNDSDDGSSTSESEASEVPDQELALVPAAQSKQMTVVQDLTEADLVHLRRTIYLTIMSSATFEECAHKLARIEVPPGRESELINMLIECCSQERTFLRYYGLIAARFCLLDDRWRDAFMVSFGEQYTTIHRLETNKLRNVSKLFAHLLHTDSMPWSVLSFVRLNEDETTSSSRIFLKIVVQEMAEAMGIAKLKRRFETDDLDHQEWYAGMFPKDNVRNTRYAINFFTSIGLGPLTDELREFLKNAPKLLMAKAKEAALAKKLDDSDSSSVSSSSSSSSSGTSSSSSSYSSSSRSDSSRSDSPDRKRSSRRRRRRQSSSSGSSSNSSSSSGSYSSRSRGRGRSSRNKRRVSRSRSSSPPKEVIRKEHSAESPSRSGKGGQVADSRSPSPLRDDNGRRDERRDSKRTGDGKRRSNRSRSPGEKDDTRSRKRSAPASPGDDRPRGKKTRSSRSPSNSSRGTGSRSLSREREGSRDKRRTRRRSSSSRSFSRSTSRK
jgi:pre-mRNA-splicing factor CWC22